MPYLPEAIESIINQSYSNLEIICINDGSSDDTSLILEQYAKKDDRIKVVHNEENLRLIATLNKGIDLANGFFIARMDADDICHPVRIELQVKLSLKENLDLIGTNVIELDQNGKKLNRILKAKNQNEINLASYFFSPFVHPSVFVKTEVLKQNKYSINNRALHTEDYELWTRIIASGYKCQNIDKELLTLRKNDQSVSHQYENIQITNFVKCALNHQQKLLEKEICITNVKVAVNRFSVISRAEYRGGLRLISEISNKLESKGIIISKQLLSLQKLDILIQSINKASTNRNKLYFYRKIFSLIVQNSLNSTFIKYLFAKFKK